MTQKHNSDTQKRVKQVNVGKVLANQNIFMHLYWSLLLIALTLPENKEKLQQGVEKECCG